MMKNEPATVNKVTIESVMNYKSVPVLHYKIEYPQFFHPCYQAGLDKINRWYKRLALDLQKEYESLLYLDAVDQFVYTFENEFPFHMNEALSVYEVTYNQDCLISLYYDHYIYTGGAHGNTERYSSTWNMQDGCRVLLSQFIKNQAVIIDNIREQVELQMSRGENWYFENYPQLIFENFNPENFYLSQEGIVIYYQQYDIAPYSSGIPEFIIPF